MSAVVFPVFISAIAVLGFSVVIFGLLRLDKMMALAALLTICVAAVFIALLLASMWSCMLTHANMCGIL